MCVCLPVCPLVLGETGGKIRGPSVCPSHRAPGSAEAFFGGCAFLHLLFSTSKYGRHVWPAVDRSFKKLYPLFLLFSLSLYRSIPGGRLNNEPYRRRIGEEKRRKNKKKKKTDRKQLDRQRPNGSLVGAPALRRSVSFHFRSPIITSSGASASVRSSAERHYAVAALSWPFVRPPKEGVRVVCLFCGVSAALPSTSAIIVPGARCIIADEMV